MDGQMNERLEQIQFFSWILNIFLFNEMGKNDCCGLNKNPNLFYLYL